MRKEPLEKEWELLLKKELKFRKKHSVQKVSILQNKLEKVIPSGLQESLEKAFYKGFQLVFQKGTKVIEKTYNKEKYQQDYEVNEYAIKLKQDRKSLKKFTKVATNNSKGNLLITGVEGVALGALGIGLPDIPIFIGVLLKSVHEIALSYGFDYESKEEQQFILQVINSSMVYEENYHNLDKELNQKILSMSKLENQDDAYEYWMKLCSKTLSNELLYMKFLQGIPLAGIIGGLSNITCLQNVNEYALLKYQRRFLLNQQNRNN